NLFKKQAKSIKFPKEVRTVFDREIKKLSLTPTYSPEYSTIKNYIEWLIDVPWNKNSATKNDIKEAPKRSLFLISKRSELKGALRRAHTSQPI
ncbi:MAG: hypothetical protein IKC23_09800, partial [Fibrobacter sp.]|nr:hypothetical protein [Fibrobacter sp.]